LDFHLSPISPEQQNLYNTVMFDRESGVPAVDQVSWSRALKQVDANACLSYSPCRGNLVCLFPTRSLFNHSCAPNAVIQRLVSSNSIQGQLYVIEDLNPGDEVCISYLSAEYLYRPTAERQEKIRSNNSWNFECACSRC